MKLFIDYLIRYPIHAFALVSTIVPIIIMIVRKERRSPLRIFFYYMVTKLCFDVLTDIYSSQKINNLIYNNFWILISFVLTSLFFYNIFNVAKIKSAIVLMSISFGIFFCLDFYFSNTDIANLNNHKLVTFSAPLRCVIVVAMCYLYFRELIIDLYIDDLYYSKIFWIVSAIFIYHAGSALSSILLHTYYNWTYDHSLNLVLRVPYVMEIVMMVVVTFGLTREKKKKSQQKSEYQ